MRKLHLILQLVGLSLCSGLVLFSSQPAPKLYWEVGSNVTFNWDFSDTKNELKYVIWMVFNLTAKTDQILRMEDENGTEVLDPNNPRPPAAYAGRLERKGKGTLVVKNITFEEATTFKCLLSGKTGVGTSTSTVQLIVTGPSSVIPDFQLHELGKSVTFFCKAIGVPSQNFTWKKARDSQTIISGAKYEVNSSVSGSSGLTIKFVSADDRGRYVCLASANANQISRADSFLEIKRPLSQDDANCVKLVYNVATSEKLSICCPVSGYPPPIVTWRKNGVVLSIREHVTLSINITTKEHFGIYTCAATDGKTDLGPFNITVMNRFVDLPVAVTDGGENAGELKWPRVPNADAYLVKVTGNDLRDDTVCRVGNQTSLDFHYNSLVFKNAEKNREETTVCAKVVALDGNDDVIAKTPTCQQITIRGGQVTLTPNIMFLLVLVYAGWKM